MHGKRAIKKNERNYPVKKSLRLIKKTIAKINDRERIAMLKANVNVNDWVRYIYCGVPGHGFVKSIEGDYYVVDDGIYLTWVHRSELIKVGV